MLTTMNASNLPNQNQSTVVLHGATGTQGRPIAERLTQASHTIRAAHRSGPTPCDLSDVDSIIATYAGADAVVVQLPLVFSDAAITQAENVLKAVHAAAVPRVVFNANGPLSPVPIGMPYVDARTVLARGLPEVTDAVTISPIGPYMENLSAPALGANIADGRLTYPLPARAPIPWVAIGDIGDMIVDSLRSDIAIPDDGLIRLLAGPEPLTGPDLAATLSTVLGHTIEWETISADAFGDLLISQIGAEAAAGIAAFYSGDTPPPPPVEHLEFGTTTLAAWAAEADWPANQ